MKRPRGQRPPKADEENQEVQSPVSRSSDGDPVAALAEEVPMTPVQLHVGFDLSQCFDGCVVETPTKLRKSSHTPFSLESCFGDIVTNSGSPPVVPDETSDSLGCFPWDKVHNWHPNRFLKLVLARLTFPPSKAKRVSKKSTSNVPAWVTMLRPLRNDASLPLPELAAQYDWTRGREAYGNFTKVIARYVGQTARFVRPQARLAWNQASVPDRMKWCYLSVPLSEGLINWQVSQSESTLAVVPAVTDIVQVSEGEEELEEKSTEGYGALFTYNTRFGLLDPAVNVILQKSAPVEELRDYIKSTGTHEKLFKKFVEHIKTTMKKFHCLSYACSMELSLNALQKGRIHMHAYIGPRLVGMSYQGFALGAKSRVEFDKNDFVFEGIMPDMRVTVVNGKRKRLVFEAVAGGYYYCLVEKPGTLFQSSNSWPVKDPWSPGRIDFPCES